MVSKELKKNIQSYQDEYSKWSKELEKYHTKFSENYEKYVGYNQISGTDSKVSDPVAAELVDRVNQKLFENDPKFFAEAIGFNLPREVKQIMSSAIEWIWNNQDTVQATGTMKSKLKLAGRELLVIGNTVVEVFWNHVSDAPDMRVVPVEDVAFDPTKTLKTSPVYYIRRFVSLAYLEDNVEIKKDGEVVTGLFDTAALKKLKRMYPDGGYTPDPTSVKIKRYNSDNPKNVDKLELITRYEGKKNCQFIKGNDDESPVAVREYENTILGTHPLAFSVDKEVVKEPYAISIIDDLSGLLKAKNLFLNQEIAYRSKVLNPPMWVDPSVATNPISMRTLGNAYKNGGIVVASKDMADHKPIPPIGNSGLDILNWIEGRAEAVSGIGAYLAGVPNQVSDKTAGTKGGIEALIQQSVSPVSDRQVNIEESLVEPVVNKWLKMLGATMGKDEYKWVLITGQSPKWVKVTKGFITGKIKLIDLMQADLIEDSEVQKLVDLMISTGKDPNKETVFDVDWVIRVETGSMAEQDTAKEVAKKQAVIQTGREWGLPIDVDKAWKDLAADAGMKEPDQYLNKEVQNGPTGEMGEGAAGAGGQGLQPLQGSAQQPTVPGMAGLSSQATGGLTGGGPI